MQSLRALFGIFKESYKIITSGNVNLYHVIFFFILPPYAIALINKIFSGILFPETSLNQTSTTTFNQIHATFASYNPYSNLFSLIYKQVDVWFIPMILVYRLLYTSAGIYIAACIRTGQEVSFQKVSAVVSKVWKRLLFTFFSTFIALFAFAAVAMLILAITRITFFKTMIISSRAGVITITLVAFFVMLAYLAGMVYLMLVSPLANVVSVLEEDGGFKAMKKSNQLLKGNIWVATIMFLCLGFVYYVLHYEFGKLVMYAWSFGMVVGAVSEMISSVLRMVLVLIEIVSQTVLYCVCKSHHHENVHNLALLDQLHQVNVSGGYAPLKTEELQLENFNYV